jgi:hypothetical protein
MDLGSLACNWRLAVSCVRAPSGKCGPRMDMGVL